MGQGCAGSVFFRDAKSPTSRKNRKTWAPNPRAPVCGLRRPKTMTWIRTLSLAEADEKLRKAIDGEKAFYPKEYAEPVHPDPSGASSIVGSHTLIPDALYHAFATFGALMSPDLPLSRRQHEMITTVVSVTNRCHY